MLEAWRFTEKNGIGSREVTRKAWLEAEWVGSVWQEIDPFKAERAISEAFKNGTSSRHIEAVKKGHDYVKVRGDIGREEIVENM